MKKLFVSKWIAASAIFGIFLFAYTLAGTLHLREPTDCSTVFDEKWIPFLPWTSWLYISLYAQMIFFVYVVPTKMFHQMVLLLSILLAIHIVLFICIPFCYPRDVYPSEYWLLKLIRASDSPKNCVPSIHVSFAVYFGSIYYYRIAKNRMKKIAMCAWSLGIILSVFTVKQHYLFDAVVSIATSAIVSFITISELRPRYKILGISDFTFNDCLLWLLTFGIRKLPK